MFFNNSKNFSKATLIGQFTKLDSEFVILNSNIKVKHQGLQKYETKNVLVEGEVNDGIFEESRVCKVEDDFDFESYKRLVKLSAMYPSIF